MLDFTTLSPLGIVLTLAFTIFSIMLGLVTFLIRQIYFDYKARLIACEKDVNHMWAKVREMAVTERIKEKLNTK